MARIIRGLIFFVLIVIPIVFYSTLNKDKNRSKTMSLLNSQQSDDLKPSVALIIDDLGESLSDLRELYSLDVPLTVSIIPNLKFSKNIANIASRCGFSVFIHLPLEPKQGEKYQSKRYRFLSPDLSQRENEALLRDYLNSLRVAVGVNNHMGSKAT
ncbi:MAG: divergent polysaccharide deacetylase family protein, partial [Candidatus Omnitrophica bacterium]|nr:divergent polysaccharide deacetylase family protein [Candidatus Omnitrophota bacterium]